jgi:hypothetical protein
LKRLKLIKHKSKTGKEIYGENMPTVPPSLPFYLLTLFPSLLTACIIILVAVQERYQKVAAAISTAILCVFYLSLEVLHAYNIPLAVGFLLYFAMWLMPPIAVLIAKIIVEKIMK